MSSRDRNAMPLVRALAAFSGALLAAYLGCNNDANNNASASASVGPAVTGAGAGSGACQYNVPDGDCNAPETCECLDCPTAAKCTERCNDNGMCELGGNVAGMGPTGEDCSCVDCYNKVPECSTQTSDCNPDFDEDQMMNLNLCTATERCTCPDCTDEAACSAACENNGVCNTAFEGCSCSDCSNHVDCGGTMTNSSSSASSTVASSVASTGAGGAGGAGGN